MSGRFPHPRFVSLRSRLFVAFVGVLLFSSALTGAAFWRQISASDARQVQSDLLTSAPSVFTQVKKDLIRFSQSEEAQDAGQRDLAAVTALRGQLTSLARASGFRILLTDYCDQVAMDTDSTSPPVSLYPQTDCRTLDDVSGRSPQPVVLSLQSPNSCKQVQQTTGLPGGSTYYYAACSASFSASYAALMGTAAWQSYTPPLLVRAIIVAKSPGGVDQRAFGSLVPELARAGAFALVVTMLVVLLIVRAITRPIQSIAQASEKMARGDYNQRVQEARNDEIGDLARSFNKMASEVSTAREMQRQFIANVSHDLKTPLTSLVGFSQILADSDEMAADATQRRAVQVINEEARRLQRLTQDLLDLSKLEAGQLQLRQQAVDLNHLAGSILERYATLPAHAGLRFLDERSVGALMVFGDADRLTQVLVNLMDNAVKFCDAAGTVALSTAAVAAGVSMTVSNTGAGIAAEDLTRVFQRFYRTDHSRATRTGGTGLGLAIVREIVVAHGGNVEARSGEDGWTRFVVILPGLAGLQAQPGDGGKARTDVSDAPAVAPARRAGA